MGRTAGPASRSRFRRAPSPPGSALVSVTGRLLVAVRVGRCLGATQRDQVRLGHHTIGVKWLLSRRRAIHVRLRRRTARRPCPRQAAPPSTPLPIRALGLHNSPHPRRNVAFPTHIDARPSQCPAHECRLAPTPAALEITATDAARSRSGSAPRPSSRPTHRCPPLRSFCRSNLDRYLLLLRKHLPSAGSS